MILHGIFVPTITPTGRDGALNEAELRRHVAWLEAKGVDGVYVNGSTGEFPRFSAEEHRRVVKAAVESKGRLKIIAGAVESSIEETLKTCEFAANLGCDAVSLCPPPYFKLEQDALFEHFSSLASRSPIPILLYNIPAFTTPLTPDTICGLAKFENVVGVKDSSRDLAMFLNLMREIREFRKNFAFFTGTEEIFLPALLMGADGGTIATAGCVPEAIVAIYEAFKSGRLEQARDLQMELLPLVKLMFSSNFPLGFRAAVELRGFDAGPCRQPLSKIQAKKLEESRAAMKFEIARILNELGVENA